MASDPKIKYDIVAQTAGASDVQRLSAELEKLDGSLDPALAQRAQEVAARMRELGAQQAAIERFRELKAASEAAAAKLSEAQAAAQKLGRELASAEAPTRAQQGQMTKLRDAVKAAAAEHVSSVRALQDHRAGLAGLGLQSDKLAQAQRGVRTEIGRFSGEAAALIDKHRQIAGAAESSAARQATAHRAVASGVQSISAQLEGIRNISLGAILGGQTAQLLKSVGDTADAYANLSARIKLVTGDGAGFAAAMQGVQDVALRTSSSLDGTATLFARIAQAGKDMGIGQQQALALTETINQAVQLSGASAEASSAALTQLIQGLQSGVLRGEEFNSVMEQSPRLAQALAGGLGVTVGQLRELAQQGKLTTSTVIGALQSQSEVLKAEFAQMPATIGRALQNLGTQWSIFIGGLDKSTGATAAVAAGINSIAGNLDTVAGMAGRAGSVLVAALAVQGVAALRALAAQALTSGAAMAALGKSIADVPRVVNITVAAVGLEVGFQIGTMLRENSEWARKLGVGVAEFFTGIINDLQFLKEAATAVFTDDTIGQAFDRFKARAQEQQAIYADLYADAVNAPTAIAAAANSAAASVSGMVPPAQAAAGAVGSIATAGQGAEAALLSLAKSAGVALPGLGATVDHLVAGLAAAAAKGGLAAKVFDHDLPAAIAKLAGPELARLRDGLSRALDAGIDKATRLKIELQAAGASYGPAMAEAQRTTKLLESAIAAAGSQAAKLLGVDLAAVSRGLTDEFGSTLDALSVLIRTMPQLQASGVDAAAAVAQAIRSMIDGAKSQQEIDAIAARLQAMGQAGQLSANVVRDGLGQAADKAAQLRAKLEDATPGIQSLGEAARKAGVDVTALLGGANEAARKSAQEMRDLVDWIVKSGTSAEKAGPVLAEAFDKRIQAAKTKEELALLAAEIERAHRAGKLVGQDVPEALDKVKRKAAEVAPEVRGIAEAYRQLGIKSQQELEAIAESHRVAWQKIKDDATATLAIKQQAFRVYAEAAIKANGGVATATLEAQAKMLGLAVEADKTGAKIVDAMDKGRKAVNDMADEAGAAGERLNQLAGSLSSVYEAETAARAKQIEANRLPGATYDKDKWATNADGSRITGGSYLPPPDSSGGWTWVPKLGDMNRYPYGGYWEKAPRGGGGAGFGATTQYAGLPGEGGARMIPNMGASAAPVTPAAPATSHTVTINLGGRATTINTASAADASALAAVLRDLEDAQQRSGS